VTGPKVATTTTVSTQKCIVEEKEKKEGSTFAENLDVDTNGRRKKFEAKGLLGWAWTFGWLGKKSRKKGNASGASAG